MVPVSIVVYTRFEHFRDCVESLKSNSFAQNTTLYVFSDGPKFGDEEKVHKIRSYAEKITGFKDIKLYFQNINNHISNINKAITIPFELNGKMILLEDDCVVSPFFLSFMNHALNHFQYNLSVLGISGYSPPVNFTNYLTGDYFKTKYFNGWGCGLWIDRCIDTVINSTKYYSDMCENKLQDKVSKIHPKLPTILKEIESSGKRAGDIKLTYYMIKNDLFQIRPSLSLVKNIGHDGSGINCGFRNEFNTQEISHQKKFTFSHTEYCPKNDEKIYNYYYKSDNILIRLKNKVLKILLYLTDKFNSYQYNFRFYK